MTNMSHVRFNHDTKFPGSHSHQGGHKNMIKQIPQGAV